MSELATTKPAGAESFSARPKVETSRGTEVAPSTTGNRLVDAANRIASFMDRLKGGRTELVETGKEGLDAGKAFLKSTGEKAAATAIKAGNVVGGAALATAEFGVGLAVLGAEAGVKGAKRVGEAINTGLDTANDWVDAKVDQVNDTINLGIARASEWTTGKIDAAKQAGVNAKEAVTGQVEKVRDFFQARAEKAKAWKEKFVRRNIARYSRTRRSVIGTVETGKAYAEAGVESAKRHGRAVRTAGQVAIATYRSASTPMPRMAN